MTVRQKTAIWPAMVLGAALTLPAFAQNTEPTALDLASDAVTRLDFPAALSALEDAIAAAPTSPAPRIARAKVHLKMQRPSLALADLDTVLTADPAHVPALIARAEIWASQSAWDRARKDLDAALAADPNNARAMALRANIAEQTGFEPDSSGPETSETSAETTAPVPVPDTAPDSRQATADARAAQIRFAPEAVMSEAHLVTTGAPDAPHTLHIVHAASDLLPKGAGPERAALERARDAGALKVVHLFTYTGEEASIWGALAFICAGPAGFTQVEAAMTDTTGREALAAAGRGDTLPLAKVLRTAYAEAGLDEVRVTGCALNRSRAMRYLADWQSHHDAGAWRDVNLLDRWPAWVLDGTSLSPAQLTARLQEIAPAAPDAAQGPAQLASASEVATQVLAPPAPATADTVAPEPLQHTALEAPPAASTEEGPADLSADNEVPAPNDGDTTAKPSAPEQPVAPTGSEAGADVDQLAANVLSAPVATPAFPPRPEPVAGVKVPVDLRGIYAPSLAGCIAYLDTIKSPTRLDGALPAMNGLSQPLGTLLVTSRRVYLFNPLDTECAIADGARSEGRWTGRLACASPLSPGAAPALDLASAETNGTAPKLTAHFAGASPVVLHQCRTLGQLGKAFAPLWEKAADQCAVSAPVATGRFTFSVDASGTLVLRVTPTGAPEPPGASAAFVALDGAPWDTSDGGWDGESWQLGLGPFQSAAKRLGWGMFLDARVSASSFEARLPLFGSSAAMAQLAACSDATE